MTDDPLEGAGVGDTETVEHTAELWLGNLADDSTRGGDRFAEHELAGAEVRTNEYGDRVLHVTVQSDVTKRLPRHWDRERHDEPAARGWALRTAWFVAGVAIATAVAHRLLDTLAGEAVTFDELALGLTPAAGLAAALAVLLWTAATVGPMTFFGGAR